MTNPPVEPRKVVPLQDCCKCGGSGEYIGWAHLPEWGTVDMARLICDCVLDQLACESELYAIDTTPNDLTRGVDVVEGV